MNAKILIATIASSCFKFQPAFGQGPLTPPSPPGPTMKTRKPTSWAGMAVLTLGAFSTLNPHLFTALAQGTAFTYQGRLDSGGTAAGGSYDFRFTLFATNVTGSAIAGPVTNKAVAVNNGLFTTTVNFGTAFAGASNWLEIGVSTNSANAFLTLSPRQQVTPTPYAITAENVVGLTVQQNTNGSPNVIAGSSVNYVANSVYGATIAGGGAANFSNSVTADFGTVGGGAANTASGWGSTVGGGAGNTASSPDGSATVGGGYYNTASGDSATVGGGDANTASGYYATVDGGYVNKSSGYYATVGGGAVNTNGSPYATIGGGGYNFIGTNSDSGTISGGFANQIADNTHDAAIGGGSYGSIGSNSFASTLAGGSHNSIGSNAIVAAIGGGTNNTASAIGTTVSGGGDNTASGQYATVVGGSTNIASGDYATAMGYHSTASGLLSTAIGDFTTASGRDSTAMGDGTTASGSFSTAIGDFTTASGLYATAMGYHSTASGFASTAIGDFTTASGRDSTAMGYEAMAVDDQSFVWNDSSGGLGAVFKSTTSNQFAVHAAGGVLLAADIQMGTNASDYHHFTLGGGNSFGFLYGSYPALGDGIHLGYNFYYDAAGNGHVANTGGATSRITAGYGVIKLDIGVVNAQPTTNRLLADINGVTVYGTFNNSSDRNAKQDFAPVSVGQILDKVLQLPLSEWSYKTDPATRHLGPMGQDFYSVFNIGTDEKHIAPIDEGGVALAAIQGLNQKVEEKDAKIKELEARLETLEKLINEKNGGVK